MQICTLFRRFFTFDSGHSNVSSEIWKMELMPEFAGRRIFHFMPVSRLKVDPLSFLYDYE